MKKMTRFCDDRITGLDGRSARLSVHFATAAVALIVMLLPLLAHANAGDITNEARAFGAHSGSIVISNTSTIKVPIRSNEFETHTVQGLPLIGDRPMAFPDIADADDTPSFPIRVF